MLLLLQFTDCASKLLLACSNLYDCAPLFRDLGGFPAFPFNFTERGLFLPSPHTLALHWNSHWQQVCDHSYSPYPESRRPGVTMLDDDVWGSDSEGDHPGRASSASELDHEWQARQSQFHTLGYRDGVEAGKNSSAQEGFNAGYAEATTPGFTWGVARGLCSAFAALPTSLRENIIGDEEARVRLDGLASSIHSFSSTDAQRSFYRDLNRDGDGGSGADVGGTRGVAEASTGDELGFVGPAEAATGEGLGFVGLAEAASRDELGFVGINRLPESHGVGVWESENSSSRTSSGASELEEFEKNVRREFERASIIVSLQGLYS